MMDRPDIENQLARIDDDIKEHEYHLPKDVKELLLYIVDLEDKKDKQDGELFKLRRDMEKIRRLSQGSK